MGPDAEILARAFKEFSEASEKIRKSYEILQKKLQETNVKLLKIIESLPNALIVCDKSGKIIASNKLAEDMFKKKLLNLHYSEIFGKELNGCGEFEYDRKVIRYLANDLRNGAEDLGRVIVFWDVTKEKKIGERNELDKRLRALGELSSHIAHELKNPLCGIEGFASILMRSLPEDDNRRKWVEKILKCVRDLEGLVNELLDFTRSCELQIRKINLKDVIDEALALLGDKAKDVKIKRDYGDVEVKADPVKLRQAILNVILNAVEAMEGKGELRIYSYHNGHPLGPVVKVVIEDTGPGIPQNILPKIFDPFFSTKKKGTGLGLAITQKIIHSHKGEIIAENTERGARFTIILPNGRGK